MEKTLGKIIKVRLGRGGYQCAMFGFTFSLESSEGWSVVDFKGTWNSDPSASSMWTKMDRDGELSKTFFQIRELMNKAKADSFTDLVGKPVEIICERGALKSWRILEEVL